MNNSTVMPAGNRVPIGKFAEEVNPTASNQVFVSSLTNPGKGAWSTLAGTGDFVGPAGATQYNLVIFADATGKLGADSLIATDGTGVLLLDDNALVIRDGAAITKRFQFDASSITAGQTRVLTVQDTDGTIALTSNKLSAFAATTSAELAGVISDETGSGLLVFATNPALTTPNIGTPSAGTLTNCTGLPTAGLVNDAVTYAKMQNVSATDKVLGRSTAGAGDVEEISCTSAGRALIDDADAAAQRTTLGLGTKATQNQSGDVVVRIIKAIPPATLFAQEAIIAGTSTPAESLSVLAFDASTVEYMDYLCEMSPKYAGGGLTIKLVWATAVASNEVAWGAALRRVEISSDDFDTTAHTYDYNIVSGGGTASATVGHWMDDVITFTDGADMDSVAAGETFILRIRRNASIGDGTDDNTGDAYLISLSIRET